MSLILLSFVFLILLFRLLEIPVLAHVLVVFFLFVYVFLPPYISCHFDYLNLRFQLSYSTVLNTELDFKDQWYMPVVWVCFCTFSSPIVTPLHLNPDLCRSLLHSHSIPSVFWLIRRKPVPGNYITKQNLWWIILNEFESCIHVMYSSVGDLAESHI